MHDADTTVDGKCSGNLFVTFIKVKGSQLLRILVSTVSIVWLCNVCCVPYCTTEPLQLYFLRHKSESIICSLSWIQFVRQHLYKTVDVDRHCGCSTIFQFWLHVQQCLYLVRYEFLTLPEYIRFFITELRPKFEKKSYLISVEYFRYQLTSVFVN